MEKAIKSKMFTAEEISHALKYMLTNELVRASGKSCDEKYINNFVNRLFNNIEEDRMHNNI